MSHPPVVVLDSTGRRWVPESDYDMLRIENEALRRWIRWYRLPWCIRKWREWSRSPWCDTVMMFVE